MSRQKHPGSFHLYFIGFLLSLEFTIIPYYLVSRHTMAGTPLLATILGIGVLQMLVQIFFFLHLGRGPKPLYNVAFYGATVVAILVVTGGSVFIMSNLHARMAPADVTQKLAQDEDIAQVGGTKTGACQGVGKNYQVTIGSGQVSAWQTKAKLCDTLTFINTDEKDRKIAFGPHPRDVTYGGESELTVSRRRSSTITLNEAGTFMFHDHTDSTVNGSFTVTP